MFTPHAPKVGINRKHTIRILWQDGRTTESCVTWYGRRTRREYRLTRFGRGFPFLTPDNLGDLLVLILRSPDDFIAYVLDLDEDIEEFQSALGVEIVGTWGVYEAGQERVETEDECIERHFRDFAGPLTAFPRGDDFSAKTVAALLDCISDFAQRPTDDRLIRAIEAEYRLFRLVERQLCQSQVCRMFASVDDFLRTAASLMNRRKSRAGRSFENHVGILLREAGVPFDVRPAVDGKPDILIPSRTAYEDKDYPTERLFVVGLKTTCKDRWRQVLEEGKRVPEKHIITLQRGISNKQLASMKSASVSLVVPKSLHTLYRRDGPMKLLTIEGFIRRVRRRLA